MNLIDRYKPYGTFFCFAQVQHKQNVPVLACVSLYTISLEWYTGVIVVIRARCVVVQHASNVHIHSDCVDPVSRSDAAAVPIARVHEDVKIRAAHFEFDIYGE